MLSCLSKRAVRNALASDSLRPFGGAGSIIKAVGDPVVISELEFSQIAMQVLFAAMLVNALHAALEDAEIAFHGVAVDRWVIVIDVLPGAMRRGAVAGEVIGNLGICVEDCGDTLLNTRTAATRRLVGAPRQMTGSARGLPLAP
jgi:hypothetical protein